MGKKKVIGLISLIVVVLAISVGVGAVIGYNHNANEVKQTAKDESVSKKNKKHKTSRIVNSRIVNKKGNDSSSVATNAKSSASSITAKSNTGDFDSLPQKTQLALLINHHFNNSPYMNIPYWPYMGTANKMVINWDGNGGMLNISFLITDNQDGTFTFSDVESSEDVLAFKSSKNSYWKAVDTVSKTTLLSEYAPHRSTVDSVASSIDMSKSSQSFTYLPVDQDTMPANPENDNSSDDDDEYYDDSEDEY